MGEKYADQEFAANATKEVESIRRNADFTGYAVTAAAFGLNEVARLTLRSPFFKLKAQNVFFWLLAPVYFARAAADKDIRKRIDGMWAIHQNRERKGLGGTFDSTGLYSERQHNQDSTIQINNGLNIERSAITEGLVFENFIDNQFHRWNSNIDKNSYHHDDIDRHTLYENDNFERMKPFQAKSKDVEGNTTIIPVDDNDALFHFYDQQGESIYTNPPDPNMPLIDHQLDQENVWAFRLSGYNQQVVMNEHARDPWQASKARHQPFWGHKLSTPAFFTEEKLQKFYKHWSQRIGLELIKMRQASEQGE